MARVGLIHFLTYKLTKPNNLVKPKLIQRKFITRKVDFLLNIKFVGHTSITYKINFALGQLKLTYYQNKMLSIHCYGFHINYRFAHHEFRMMVGEQTRIIYSHYPYEEPERGDDDFDIIIDVNDTDYRTLFLEYYNAPNYPNPYDGQKDYPRISNEYGVTRYL